jgi:chemotaxis response regulator CheB
MDSPQAIGIASDRLERRAEMAIRVLVADDTQLMRRAICGFLRGRLEIEIVGEAADYAETVQMADDFRPEIILMDLHLACQPGITPLDVRTKLNHVWLRSPSRTTRKQRLWRRVLARLRCWIR